MSGKKKMLLVVMLGVDDIESEVSTSERLDSDVQRHSELPRSGEPLCAEAHTVAKRRSDAVRDIV